MWTQAPFVVVENVRPELNGGRFPVKAIVGDDFIVSADIYKEGHDVIAAVARYRPPSSDEWREVALRPGENDRWSGSFRLDRLGRYAYTIEAWPDAWRSWRADFAKRVTAGQELTGELIEGRRLLGQIAERAGEAGDRRFERMLATFDTGDETERIRLVLDDELSVVADLHPDRRHGTIYEPTLEVVVNRPAAEYAAWYEFFPRSQGTRSDQSATFQDAVRRLPDVKRMGFDVVYLPPIHPIGETSRKGPNNSVISRPGDPGCPYAIGNAHGGHKAIEPSLGTLADFDDFVAAAGDLGLEVALDIAIQCSPDHPYVREHPEWFYRRADGTIKYAENPPKKYEDIFPVNFYTEDREGLWREMSSIFRFWIEHGVKTFRVDNPHTKPIAFWEWLIADVQRDHPDTIFLTEAFTLPKLMKMLAKVGFTQSYTYFTWRNFKKEIEEYFTDLTQTDTRHYLRGNLFPNTPDILPFYLQEGELPAFKIRLALAATLSSVYGIYGGFELGENRAVPGKEEYLDSEKYQLKVWDWDRPGNIKDYVATINRIRQENPALQRYENLRFYPTDDDNVVAYGKMTPAADNAIIVAVNLDPFQAHQASIAVPIDRLGIRPDEKYLVHELITDQKQFWQGNQDAYRSTRRSSQRRSLRSGVGPTRRTTIRATRTDPRHRLGFGPEPGN